MKARVLRVLGALIMVAALASGAALWRARGTSAPPASQPTSPEPTASTAEPIAVLENSLHAIADGERDAPRDRWDPAYVVAQAGRHPDTLRAWVQENTSWIPYRGVLRGPVGVLMDRQGNSLDRALLLAELLRQAGHTVRLARAAISVERARAILPELVAGLVGTAVTEAEFIAEPTPSIREISERYGLNPVAVERTLEAYDAGTARLLSKLEERAGSQAARLLSAVPGPVAGAEWQTRADSALAALQDHWWVQLAAHGSWVDLDLVANDRTNSALLPTPLETVSPTGLHRSLHHQVTVRVVAERFTNGSLAEAQTLTHTLRASDVMGQAIALQLWPTAWPAGPASPEEGAQSFRRLALDQDEWSASLVIGNDLVAETRLSGSTTSAKPGAGPLGGLGGAIAEGLRPREKASGDAEDSLLTAVWLEYEIDVPGRAPRSLRRTVFDLIGPAARLAARPRPLLALDERQRLIRSLSLMMRTEILPLAAQPAPEFVLHLGARSALANAHVFRAVALPGFGSDRAAAESVLDKSQAPVSPLYTFAVLRQEALGNLAFFDRPNVLTRHQYFGLRGDDMVAHDALDIVANEVGISLIEPEGFGARLAQGVWDTNLEAALGIAGGPVGNTAEAYADASGDWRVLTAGEAGSPLPRLPDDALALLARDLRGGYTVVAPPTPVAREREAFAGWWRIDPATGDALGIADNGWGQAVDYGLHVAALAEMAKPFVFTYALCQFIPQEANALNILGNEFWRLGLHPSWTSQPRTPGKDFEEVAAENHRMCLIEAITAGFVATAPLLLRTVALRTEAELANEARLARRPGVTMPTIEAPPGTGPKPRGYPAPGGPAPRGGPRGTVPGGSRPPGADPVGKTNPDLDRTQPGPPQPGSNPQENLKRVAAAERAAKIKAGEATGDWVRYRYNMPPSEPDPRWRGDPSKWSQSGDDALRQRMRETEKEWYARQSELEAAQRAAGAPQGARGRGGFPPPRPAPGQAPAPNLPGCPPNCGNNNPTGPAGQAQAPGSSPRGALQVGSAGIAGSFYPITWPWGIGQ